MEIIMKYLIFISMLLTLNLSALQLGETPLDVVLDGKNGGKVDGTVWNSNMLTGKVHVLFYVDPDKKDVNEAFADALKSANFNHANYSTVAIVNLAATWKPNIIIEALLKSKQKKFPEAMYVKDKKKVLVKRWQLADDASNVVVFGKDGKVLYFKDGKLDQNEIFKVIQLIKDNL
jgi:YtfJ family uncharacterized protein